MPTTADIRNGLVLRFNNDIYAVVEFQHVKPGKGNAFVRTKIKSLTNGRVLENTFPSGAKLEEVAVQRRKYQFLYAEGDALEFMDSISFDQLSVPRAQVPGAEFLSEGLECQLLFDTEAEQLLSVELPTFVVQEVTYAEPGARLDATSNTLKPATVASGAAVRVPQFIKQGERVKIDTRTGTYVERVN